MGDLGKTSDNRIRHTIIFGVLGVFLLIVGIAIVNIHGNPLRGSGLGTASILAGIALLALAGIRYFYKRPQ
jgi:hypothetical protein